MGLLPTIAGAGDEDVHPECRTAVEELGRALAGEGHEVVLAHPEPLDHRDEMHGAFQTLVSSWVASALDEWSEASGKEIGPEDVEPGTGLLAEFGRAVSAADYVTTAKWIGAFTRRMAAWWQGGFDLLITPTISETPPELGYFSAREGEDGLAVVGRLLRMISFTMPFNLTGQPAVSLPVHWSPEGLPVGVQLVGRMWDEALLFRLSAEIEQLVPWAGKLPSVHA
jgi:amidase